MKTPLMSPLPDVSQETLVPEETNSQKYITDSSSSYTSSTHLVRIKVCKTLKTLKRDQGVEPLLEVYLLLLCKDLKQ